jgi:hypothetical protein
MQTTEKNQSPIISRAAKKRKISELTASSPREKEDSQQGATNEKTMFLIDTCSSKGYKVIRD